MKKTIFYKFLLVLTGAFSLTACLKDEGFEEGKYGAVRNTAGKEYVTIPMAAKKAHILTLESKAGPQTLELFPLSYDYVDPAASEFTAKVRLNNTLVTAYDPNVVILPTAAFTVPSPDVKFQAGQRISQKFAISINTSLLDPSKVYGLGLSLESVSKPGVQLSSNLNDVLFIFTVKNRFDGEYTMTGTLVDNANSALTAKSPTTVYLITEGANTARVFNAGTATSSFKELFPIMNGAAESAYGAFMPVFTIDANNNVTSVVNAHGQPASNTRSAEIDPSGINKYDPGTKTLKVKWFMYQPSAIAGIRTSFDFTFTYVKPRP
jgi:hypothetical protein